MPDVATLQELRQKLAARGEATAILAYTGEREEVWSFAKLGEISARLASGLAQLGVSAGDNVGLIAPNSPLWIAAFWSIIAAGGVATPLDAQASDRDLARMLDFAGCRVVFTTNAIAHRLQAIAPSCRPVILDGENRSAAGEPWQNLLAPPGIASPRPAAASDVAIIVFTSGTTGTPKAVPLTHANLLTNVLTLAATHLVGPGDRALLPLPLHHVYPLIIGMLTPFALGCGIILPAGVSGPEILSAMRRGNAAALIGVPRLYTALLDNVRRGIAAQPLPLAAFWREALAVAEWSHRHGASWPGRILLRPVRRRVAPDLRLLVSGGAAIDIEVEETLDAMGWEMLTGYGLVETSSMLTFNPPGAALPGSVGRPVPGMAVRVAQPGPDGVGEIEVHGPSLFHGYGDDPARTREAFTCDGWFRTGDLGSLDDRGYLHIAARKAETIVLADGKKLFPEEFESIYVTAPLIREIALLGVNGALVGLVIPDLAAARDVGALRLGDMIRDGLAAKGNTLPSYARLSGFAIGYEALPRTQLGKIRRYLLPALYERAQRHEPARVEGELSAEDRALLENPTAASLWHWLAQRFADRSLRLDTVPQLDLGIDSLGWVELTLALERDLGIVLRESEIARIVTLRDLLHEAAAHAGEKAALPASAEARWLAPLGPGLVILRVIGEALIGVAMRLAFRLRVEGVELIPPDDPILICPNHASYLDPFAVGIALPRDRLRRTYWGGWTGIAFSTPLRRLFSRVARVIPVDPDRVVGAGISLAGLALERGWNLVWFPEGARSLDGTVQHFLPGIAALIEKRPVPIVPVYIEGSFASWPAGRKFPRFLPITVRFGKAVDPVPLLAEASGRDRDDRIVEAVRRAVSALA